MSHSESTATRQNLVGRHPVAIVILTLVVGVGAGIVLRHAAGPSAAEPEPATLTQTADEQPTEWTCSMHPQIRSNKPGKCPICGMDLIPVTKTAAGGLRTLAITPEARALMNVETVPVERKFVTAEVRMVGKVQYDETRLGYITAWVPGRLDRLYVDFTGVMVSKGDHMVFIYSPDLYSAQEELIQAIRFSRGRGDSADIGGVNMVESAREKLRLLGLADAQIREIEQHDQPSDHVTIYSPVSGIVIEKLRQEGDYVRTGERIYTVADLSQVWVELEAYESDLAWLRPAGQQVTFNTEAYPGEEFVGRVSFIQPVLDDETRTVKVRVNVPNPRLKLKPDMFVRGMVRSQVAEGGQVIDRALEGKWLCPMHPWVVKDEFGACDICGMPLVPAESLGYVAGKGAASEPPLVIPKSAPLITGTRAVVYVELPGTKEPTYEGREIVLGPKAGDYYLVRHGLAEGELVVARGTFKIDSEIQIQARPSMMTPGGGGGGGHQHGGQPAAGAAPAAANAEMALPHKFVADLAQLHAAHRDVAAALQTEEVPSVRAAFARLQGVLDSAGAPPPADHAAMMWKELSMLLGNDAFEGRAVADLDAARRVAALVDQHMQQVDKAFGRLHDQHGAPTTAELTVPPDFQRQLAALWRAYLPLQAALASDDYAASAEAVDHLADALAGIDTTGFNEMAGAAWKGHQPQIAAAVTGMQSAQDIEAIRAAFRPLSDQLAVLAESFGFGDVATVYRLHCPMAFQGQGAYWLQDNPEPRNPYYGATMLTCNDLVEQIAGGSQNNAQPLSKPHPHEQL